MTSQSSPPRERFETRLPCPVCVGIMMEKAQLRGARGALTLDHCERCGGIWFEQGEVRQLATRAPAELWAQVAPRSDTPRPPCHGCGTPLDRDAAKCPACGRANDIDCPTCARPMARRSFGTLVLDICERCQGAWFDHAELTAIWTMNVQAATNRRFGRTGDAMGVGGEVLLQGMFWAPDLMIEGAAGAMQVGGAAFEVAGEAAEGVFSAILDFIGSLFGG